MAASALLLYIIAANTLTIHRRLQFSDAHTAAEEVLAYPNGNGYHGIPARVAGYFSSPNETRRDYREWNSQTLRELHTCMALDNCGPNQRKVALLAAHWFDEAIVRGWRGGEGVW